MNCAVAQIPSSSFAGQVEKGFPLSPACSEESRGVCASELNTELWHQATSP